jgi:glycosyltransferase involved in cell wall biosynthesis
VPAGPETAGSDGPPLRVLLCHNYYLHDGGESSVFEAQAAGLEARGHPVSLYTRRNAELDSLRGLARAAVVPAGFSSPRTRREVRALVARERPDVAIVQNVFPLISPSLYPTLRGLGVPVIQAVYNYRFVCPAGELYSHGAICERCLGGNHIHCVVRRCYRDSAALSAWYAGILGLHRMLGSFRRCIDCFMVPDEFLGRKLVEGGIPASLIRKNVSPFFAGETGPEAPHQGYALFVGRLVRQKGILTLLRAIPRLESGAGLRIVGHGELEGEIRRTIRDQGLDDRVVLVGPRWGRELDELISGAAAVVIPSEWYDNLPLVLCQANARGRPVIASRIDGIPEYVRDGVNGFLFSPGDPRELARLIDHVVGLGPADHRRLARTSRRRAVEEFDFEAHYRTLLGVMQRLVASRSSGPPRRPRRRTDADSPGSDVL